MTPEIRRAAAADWPAIARLCEDTGRQGNPIPDEERGPFGEHWVGPYRELRPDWTFVAVLDGKIVGYLNGCPDTLPFEKEKRRVFNPQPDSRELFTLETRLNMWTEHPAHIHMNVASGLRRSGAGRLMMDAYFAALREAGVPSIHVVCGPNARPFWEHVGFREYATVEAAPGVIVSALTLKIA